MERSLLPTQQERYFGSDAVPTWAKMLRLLQIRSCDINDIIDILGMDSDLVNDILTKMRKEQLVLMTPQRRNEKLVKIYEILPEGIEIIDKADMGKFNEQGSDTIQRLDIHEIIEQIQEMIKMSQLSDSERIGILNKIKVLKSKLDV